MTGKPAVRVKDLKKSFGDTVALDEVSFSVESGEIFGFIGPDGAGKTSLFRILTTLLLADSGEAEVDGLDIVSDYRRLRERLGYMPGRFSLYQDLSVEENLRFFATVFGTTIEANYDLIADIYKQIEPFKDRKAGALSGGMKQKLALSCALIHRPVVLFLDEPTTGVDAVSRKEFWEMLIRLKEAGITIVVSTPYMDEAMQCDRVALIQQGRLLEVAPPAEVAASFDRPLYAVRGEPRHQLIQTLRRYENARSVYPFGETIHVTDEQRGPAPDALQQFLTSEGFSEARVTEIDASIEDVFMQRVVETA